MEIKSFSARERRKSVGERVCLVDNEATCLPFSRFPVQLVTRWPKVISVTSGRRTTKSS